MMFNTATVILFTLLGALTGGLVVLFEQWRGEKELALFWSAVYDTADHLAEHMFDDAYSHFRKEVSESAVRIQNLQREAFELKAQNSKLVIQLLDPQPKGWSFVEPTDEKKLVTTPSSNNEDDEDDFEW
jgi:hypothetical protein